MTTQQIPEKKRGHVLVQLVWPEERGEKIDCRNGTDIVWSKRLEVQNYPEALWPKLAFHPDVWRLYDPEKDKPAAKPVEEDQEDLKQRQEEAAGRNTDLVAVVVGFDDEPAGEAVEVQAHEAEKAVDLSLTQADLDVLQDQEIRQLAIDREYGLHPRLKRENLIEQFLIAQRHRNSSEAGSAE